MSLILILLPASSQTKVSSAAFMPPAYRSVEDFDTGWLFSLGEQTGAEKEPTDDSKWRKLNLPHDWSIEGKFSKDHPATVDGGALPGGIGWYRKHFKVKEGTKGSKVYVEFDGIYQCSDVWLNGHHLGFRPNGYISFRYDLTPFLNYSGPNLIAVRVNNSEQPNSRFYSGSGIYRNVRLVTTGSVAVDHWGTFVTTPVVSADSARVKVEVAVRNTGAPVQSTVTLTVLDASGRPVATRSEETSLADSLTKSTSQILIKKPTLWSVDAPYLYKLVTEIRVGKSVQDRYETPFGVRYFRFDEAQGFFLNGKPLKILGVCNHHDLGALGSAVNSRALQRQLELLKTMGCNAIRTSHNPPAPELLDLCDQLGFIVMDEAFDMWVKQKRKYDYHRYFKEWHKRDLEAQVLRDRNHPSVFMWSIGNEIPEQTDTNGFRIARELTSIIKALDTTRSITSANSRPGKDNQIVASGAVDLAGYNYELKAAARFPEVHPGKKFIGTETTSALETRGSYDMPSDSIRRWGDRKHPGGNADFTVSAYYNVSANWGSTHEEAWKVYKKYPFMSGMFIWTGFDYLGEPTPYPWPARSSYFGILDLQVFQRTSTTCIRVSGQQNPSYTYSLIGIGSQAVLSTYGPFTAAQMRLNFTWTAFHWANGQRKVTICMCFGASLTSQACFPPFLEKTANKSLPPGFDCRKAVENCTRTRSPGHSR